MIHIRVSPDPIDVAAEFGRIEPAGIGAIASFSGLVRADDGVELLELEHYPGVTETMLAGLAEQARGRWSLAAVSVVHRVGPMRPGERIVFVGTAAAHRAAALEACAFLIDRLKTDAPFWKRETRGPEHRWVEASDDDGAAAARWTG
ncbi:molybdenum cofactor biosynthesis protein MoaE [uncultured Sphingomonas sp.]|uniref:molybdenum cofactor biosynthesis protein MoaE n=1 Tax=uncultured Sphingomonas sp. TaxID=158754 RepID=UPI0035CC7898